MQVTPADIVEIIKAVGGAVALVCGPLAGIYVVVSERRQKRRDAERADLLQRTKDLNTKIDGMLMERDASNILKGERRGEQTGRDTAVALAEGQRQGRETERASVIARGLESNKPLPVEDEGSVATRTAEASERSANAQERVADATERKP